MLACSVGDEAGEIFQKLSVGNPSLIGVPGFERLFFLIGAYNRPQEVDAALNALATAIPAREKRRGELDSESLLLFGANLARGLERSGSSLTRFAGQDHLKPIFTLAQQWATQPEPEPTRFNSAGAPIEIRRGDALTLLGCAAKELATPTLLDTVERYPHFATEALTALSRHSTLEVTTNLLERWPRLTPGARNEVIAALLKKTENAKALLAALNTGLLKRADFSTAQIEFLRSYRDSAVRAEATRLLTRENTATRQAVIDAFQGALSLRGSPEKGKVLFDARCETCHQLRGRGHGLGPDLATVKNAGKEKLLTNILDPNREVNPNYLSYLVETKDGESLAGLIINESANSVTLRMAGGAESVVARANIASMQSQGKSLMPEGLEEGLSQQDMADLVEFIVATP
jgi:putative heme-binding domain-containing protein